MEQSEQIDKLATAMAKAQLNIQAAHKNQANPFFKSNYADLDSTWDACREPLSKEGLAIVQMPSTDEGVVIVTTILMHSSGQWIRETMACRPQKGDAQAMGAVVSYLRRYMLGAAAGVAQADADAQNIKAKPARQMTGPIKTATALRNKMNDMRNDVMDAKSKVELEGVMELYQDLLDQVADDAPTLWTGPEGESGLQHLVERLQIELPDYAEESEPDDGPDLEPIKVPVNLKQNGEPDWATWRKAIETQIKEINDPDQLADFADANKPAFQQFTKAHKATAAAKGLKKKLDLRRAALTPEI